MATVLGHWGWPLNTVCHTSLVDRLASRTGGRLPHAVKIRIIFWFAVLYGTREVRQGIAIKKFKHPPLKQTQTFQKESKQNTLLWVAAVPGGKPPRKTYLSLNAFLERNVIFGLQTAFFDGSNVLMGLLAENDAESLCHFVKIPFLDLKRAKLDQKSEIGHVRTDQDLFH